MSAWKKRLIDVIGDTREVLVEKATSIVFAANDTPIPRADVVQMMRACVSIVEEALLGETDEVRAGFLEALPDIARTTSWSLTLKNGIPCWTAIMGRLVTALPAGDQDEAITWFSSFIGEWWSDVSKAMLPICIAEGKL